MTYLFVCRGNVGRSQIARALYEKYSGEHADSAGIEVSKIGEKLKDKESARLVIDSMNAIGIDVSERTRTRFEPYMINSYDKIIVLAKKSECPEYLLNSKKAIFWEIEDTHGKSADVYARTIHDIGKLVKNLINEK